MDHIGYCEAAADVIGRMAHDVRGLDPGLAVPACPGWDVRRVVAHVGGIHRWAADMVATRSPVRKPREDDAEITGPDLEAWLGDGAALVRGMAATPGDAEMWAWGADKHVRFWPRRMVHETAVHHADLLLAAGRPADLDPELAADGIDELLANLPYAAYFAPRVVNLKGAGSISLEATDLPTGWAIRLQPDGFQWERTALEDPASVAVRGRAGDLLLLMYGRWAPSADVLDVIGDVGLLVRWLDAAAL